MRRGNGDTVNAVTRGLGLRLRCGGSNERNAMYGRWTGREAEAVAEAVGREERRSGRAREIHYGRTSGADAKGMVCANA